jgi:hypothetical protein
MTSLFSFVHKTAHYPAPDNPTLQQFRLSFLRHPFTIPIAFLKIEQDKTTDSGHLGIPARTEMRQPFRQLSVLYNIHPFAVKKN